MPALCADPRCRGRNQHTDAAGPLPACLDAVAGALRPSRARGAGPPRRGRRSRCPPAPTLTTVASIASGEDGAVPEDDVPTGDVVSEPAASPGVYRLRAALHAVSPLIWRRLLVSGESTVADLHTIVQTAFGWGGEHLHRFVIHGAEYGINYVGGPGFRDARQVRLGGLGLRVGERFFYEYNFFAGWRVDLRVEEIVAGRTRPGVSALHRRAASRPTRGLGRTVGVPRRHPAAPGVRRDATRRRDRGPAAGRRSRRRAGHRGCGSRRAHRAAAAARVGAVRPPRAQPGPGRPRHHNGDEAVMKVTVQVVVQ